MSLIVEENSGSFTGNMNFLEYLNNKQSELNLSQNNFATYLGVDKTALSRMLSGNRQPSAEFIIRVCMKFDEEKLITAFYLESIR